jgi:serine protease AprX
VAAPDFSLSVAPASQSVAAGNGTSYAVTITPTGGFSGQVGLSVSGLPGGATGTFTPNPATGLSTLAVTTATTTPTGTSTASAARLR